MILVVTASIIGCDNPPPAPTSQPAPKHYQIQIESLATLLPRRPTHLTLAPDGTLFYVQEKQSGEDVLFTIPPGGIAQAMALTPQRIGAALGKREGISGNIQSVAADQQNRVFFCFSGGTKRTDYSCLGIYSPLDDSIRIIADSATLAKATSMGDAINLARSSVIVSGNTLWLAVQNMSSACVFRIPISTIDSSQTPSFIPAFTSLTTDFGKAELYPEEVTFAAGAQESLLVTDRYTGSVWEVDAVGHASLVQNLVGLPINLASAGIDSRGNYATVYNDGAPIMPRLDGHIDPVSNTEISPAFLLHRSDLTLLMGRDSFLPSAGFSISTVSLQQLIADATPDRWIGYDQTSGEIIRLRLIPGR